MPTCCSANAGKAGTATATRPQRRRRIHHMKPLNLTKHRPLRRLRRPCDGQLGRSPTATTCWAQSMWAREGSILYLGNVGRSVEAQRGVCARADCQSFVYHSPGLRDFAHKPESFRGLCYGRLDSVWDPKHQKGVYSERRQAYSGKAPATGTGQPCYQPCDPSKPVLAHRFTRSGFGNEVTQLILSLSQPNVGCHRAGYAGEVIWLGTGRRRVR